MNPNAEKQTSGAHPRAVPSAPNFDTLEIAEKLKKAEFSDQQAMTLVETIQDAQAGLATKEDLVGVELALRGDMEKMETGIRRDMEKMEAGIRHDMEKMEAGIRRGMEKMEAGIRGDMEKMGFGIRHEMEAGFRDMEIRFQKLQWYILSAIVGAASMFSAAILYGGA